MPNPEPSPDPEMPASTDAPDEPQALRPVDEPPPGDDPPPPDFPRVRINGVSPLAGALAGGIDIVLTGSGFQEGAEVFFGSSQSPEVAVHGPDSATATLPAAEQTGSVNVTLVNPDGTSATRAGGFTYVVTGTGAQAEVQGVEPLAVIEDTESEITISGRNLIEAYTNGMLALRGPTRVHVAPSDAATSRDEATGLESLTLTVRVTCTPPLEQHERMAVQVLASRRPGAQQDGVFESSRQMFTVLPRAMPVPVAFSDNLEPDRPTLVVVAGRNLEGCTLDFGEGATVHTQSSDDRAVVAVVTVSDGLAKSVGASTPLFIRSDAGGEVARYEMSVATREEAAQAKAARAAASAESAGAEEVGAAPDSEAVAGDVGMTLAAVPGQQMLGPTEQDSVVFNLGTGGSPSGFAFNYFDFAFVIFERTLVLRLINEVRVIPFFDGGSGEDEPGTKPVLAQVGRLFRLRGLGLLVVLRVEIIIHVSVVLIVGFRFNIWPFGLFNEFPEFGWAIGSVVVSVVILIQLRLLISFLVAAVLPGGRLRVIFYFNLTLGVEVVISADGRRLSFGGRFIHEVNHTRIGPRRNTPFHCDGRLQLAEENGETVFPDNFGGHQSFYFAHSAGACCVPWDFELQLTRFAEGGGREVVQSSFRTEYCLNAAPGPGPHDVLIVSDRDPTGFPPPLELEVGESSAVRAMARPVDERGQPIPGAPRRDLREMGFTVEFYLERPVEPVLDRGLLKPGHALAVEPGGNVIRAAVTSPPRIIDVESGEELPFSFWPGSILGFDIVSFLARGLMPAVRTGGLPVEVSQLAPNTFTAEPTLVFKNEQNQWQETAALPNLLPGEVTRELERPEPFEPRREYALAVRLPDLPDNVYPLTLTIKVKRVEMAVLPTNSNTPVDLAPLGDIPRLREVDEYRRFNPTRASGKNSNQFFTGKLIEVNQEGTVTLNAKPADPRELFVVTAPSNVPGQPPAPLAVSPNHREDSSASPRQLVPPGVRVADRHVLLSLSLEGRSSGPGVRRMGTLRTVVRNDETFEEYLRVFEEVESIMLAAGPRFRDGAGNFYATLRGRGAGPDVLTEQGADLWEDASAAVRSAPPFGASPGRDDRPLYWTRLQSIAALRAYARRHGVTLTETMVDQFEWPSRGLQWPSGAINFADAATTRVNVALSSAGAAATATSTLNAGHDALAAINGDRRGLHWGSDPATGSGWHDATPDDFPDTLEIAFAGERTITEVNVFSVQDDITSPAEPTEAMTFTLFGLQDFDVEYWSGAAWQVVPGGSVTGNNKVWRKLTFAPLATTRIRVVVRRGLDKHSRVVEVEAWASLASARKAVVTGFDPFFLPRDPAKSNSSGLVALHFNRQTLDVNQSLVHVRTAVFPVRYQDFDERMVENAVVPHLGTLALLMTTSRGRPGFYDVERFAGRNRGPKKFTPNDPQTPGADPTENNLIDNNRSLKTELTEPPGLEPGAQYLESTLPYTAVITSVDATRLLPGPQPGPSFVDNNAFVLNQAYWVLNAPPAEAAGRRRPETTSAADPNGYVKFPEVPDPSAVAFEASGGNYLSNEVFYRTALERNKRRASLKSGHLHLPWLDEPQRDGPGVLEAVRRALERFLLHPFRGVRSSGNITFPRTAVNTRSQPRSLSAVNETGQLIRIGGVRVPAGFAFVPPAGGFPIPVNRNSSVPLSFTFTPTEARPYAGDVTVLDEAGEPLFTARLIGEGVAAAPIPVVTNFSPPAGRPGAWVTVNGENFDETVEVRIGGTGVPFTVVDANSTRANVTDEVFTGHVEVETPHGVAVSSGVFRVVRRFPRELLAEHLRERRLGLGITQRVAAQQMGVKASTYSNWERGRDEPRSVSFPAIIGFLGYDPSPAAPTLPERIREARQREGLSQRQLAARLGVAASTVKAWESDTVRRPTPRVAGIFEEYVKGL